MREFIRQIAGALGAGMDVELVSVIASTGSTPRGAGAQMAVFSDGGVAGSIGGGNAEFSAQQLAAELLQQGKDAQRSFRFVQGDAASLGMVCGGDVTLQFQYFSAQDPDAAALFQDWLQATEKNLDVWLVRKVEQETVVSTALVTRERLKQFPEIAADFLHSKTVFRDGWISIPVVQAGRVYIFGGGHVSQALVPAIAAVGFSPVVYDDRPEFVDPARFPQAEETHLVDFNDLSGIAPVTADDYVVVMTRGHQADYEVLTQTLRSGAKYIGCIGSRRKLSICRDRLLEAGFTAEEYEKVHAPIGLWIGAETPAEIAVSVTAELIAVRAGVLQ